VCLWGRAPVSHTPLSARRSPSHAWGALGGRLPPELGPGDRGAGGCGLLGVFTTASELGDHGAFLDTHLTFLPPPLSPSHPSIFEKKTNACPHQPNHKHSKLFTKGETKRKWWIASIYHNPSALNPGIPLSYSYYLYVIT
jgi:hypothetical protein